MTEMKAGAVLVTPSKNLDRMMHMSNVRVHALKKMEPMDRIDIEPETADILRYTDTDLLKFVINSEKIVAKKRWHTVTDRIFKHHNNGAYYRFRWPEPNTESQELDLTEHCFIERVYPTDVTTTVYRTKDENPRAGDG